MGAASPQTIDLSRQPPRSTKVNAYPSRASPWDWAAAQSDCTISAATEKDRERMAPIKFARPNQDWLTCSQDPSTARTIHAYAPNGIFLKPGFCGKPSPAE